jgi:hypothetical protein
MYYENIADVCEHADDEYQEQKLLTWITFHVRRSRGRCAQIWKADQLKIDGSRSKESILLTRKSVSSSPAVTLHFFVLHCTLTYSR